MTDAQVIVLATPVFLLLIVLEFTVGRLRGRDTYRLADTLSSIGLGIMSQLSGLFGKLLIGGVYVLVFHTLAPWQLPASEPWVWVTGLLPYDFCYYWHHRAGHRVHHAVNDAYVDRNDGGILFVWDRLFGSFQDEVSDQACVYGTRTPLRSWNPLRANLQVHADLWHDSRRARAWSDKLRVWFKPPGWRPADLAVRHPRPAFDLAAVQRHDPPLPSGAASAAQPACGP